MSQRGPRVRICREAHRGDSIGAQLRIGSRANFDLGLCIALGEHVHDYFIRNKRREWDSYKEQVTPWELDRYLGSL